MQDVFTCRLQFSVELILQGFYLPLKYLVGRFLLECAPFYDCQSLQYVGSK